MATKKAQQKKVTARAMDATNASYNELSPVWVKCRAAAKGQRAIHKGGEIFLPRLSGQTDDEYKSYVARALFFNATGRTLEAMVGLAFRKDGQLDMPKAMEEWLKDVTMSGISLDGMSRDLLTQTLEVGRVGVLVDHPVAPFMQEGVQLTIEQAKSMNMRPYAVIYKTENVLDWRAERVGAVTKLVNVTLQETYIEGGKEKVQIRELTMAGGFYEQIVWRKLENQTDQAKWQEHERVTPMISNKPMNDIPFWFIGPKEKNWDVCDPPIEDLVYVNISHYQNSADLENGAHISGLPTPYITGITKDPTSPALHLGTGTAWLIPNENSEVGFCQVGDQGFASLEKLMDRKEQQMAAIGARLIAPEKKAAETAETANIRRSGETSVLADIVRLVSKNIQDIMQFMANWSSIKGEVVYSLNTDFLPIGMSAQDLTALLSAVQAGKMSQQTFFDCIKAGEVVPQSLTFEDEQERIKNDGPALGTLTDDDDVDDK